MLGDVLVNGSGDGLGTHGVERLGVLYCVIFSTSSECVHYVGRVDRLIFSENVAIGVASGGYRYDAMGRDGVPFYLFSADGNVDDERGKGFNLTVSRLVKRRAGVSKGG